MKRTRCYAESIIPPDSDPGRQESKNDISISPNFPFEIKKSLTRREVYILSKIVIVHIFFFGGGGGKFKYDTFKFLYIQKSKNP